MFCVKLKKNTKPLTLFLKIDFQLRAQLRGFLYWVVRYNGFDGIMYRIQVLNYLYIWIISKFKVHLSKTNQTIVIGNMDLLCYSTWKKGKGKRKRKLATNF